MSIHFLIFCGNSNIHHYPLGKKLRLEKLLCISQEIYKDLKRQVSLLVLRSKKKRPKGTRQLEHLWERFTPKEKCPSGLPFARPNLSCYMPTDIWQTRESSYWQWRRVDEWFRQFQEDDPYGSSERKRLPKELKWIA